MTVAGKLLAILAFVALAPLGVFALGALREHEQALGKELAALHGKTAEHGARTTTMILDATRRTVVGLAGAIPWGELAEAERAGALLLVYEQLDDVAVAALFDARGAPVGASVSRDQARDRHPRASAETLASFAAAIPPLTTRSTTPQLGEPFGSGDEPPIVPLAVPIVGPDGARWLLAIGLSLRSLCAELAAASPPGVATRLAGARGQRLCGTPSSTGDLLTASAGLEQGWSVTAEQPSEAAYASLRRLRIQSAIWILLGVAGAVGAGLVLTQTIRKPLRQLTRGAEALAAGDLAHRVPVASRDELGDLAASFNQMGEEIERKTLEIRSWNDALQARVDARTGELLAAQEQLLQSRKLGAVAALGAGIAHEINNPLAGVVGLTQVLLARKDKLDERTLKSLASIEREALRIREIVDRMSSLAQASVSDATRLDLTTVVDASAEQHGEQLAASKVELERMFAPNVPAVLGNAAQLQHAIGQLVDNSIRAMPTGGRLRITVRSIEGALVAVDVEDTGRGIDPDVIDKIFEPFFTGKEHWRGVGLGLTIVHRIVEAHQGRIRASSQLGAGTTMTITLPAAPRTAHLA